MSLYNLIVTPFTKNMDVEKASRIGLRYFQIIGKIPFGRKFVRWIYGNKEQGLQREVFGLDFYNPIGLGAGLDRRGELYNDLNNLGFSFVEIGPMGSEGARKAIAHIQADPQNDILAVCIDEDYANAFTLAYDFFDFFVIDISADPSAEELNPLLEARIAESVYKPVVVKIPDYIKGPELQRTANFCLMNNVDGIEVRSKEQIRELNSFTHGRLPIIANCHIDSPEQAAEALACGASLVELRSGLLKQGPGIIGKALKYLLNKGYNEQASTV